MTNKEAIHNLENWKLFDKKIVEIDGDLGESIRLAIKALEREENLEQALSITEDNSAVVKENLTSDLISRSALKKVLLDAYEEYDGYDPNDLRKFAERVDDEIDNASTVDTYTEDDVQYAIKEGHQIGYGMAKAKFERPTGKWCVISLLDDYVYLKCSECGQSTRLVRDSKNEFCSIKDVRNKVISCPYCRADMRGDKKC